MRSAMTYFLISTNPSSTDTFFPWLFFHFLCYHYFFRCCCGLPLVSHTIPLMAPVSAHMEPESPMLDPRPLPGEHWNPNKHTIALPTDAYGYVKNLQCCQLKKLFCQICQHWLKAWERFSLKIESQVEENFGKVKY